MTFNFTASRRRFGATALALAGMLATTGSVWAQAYPSQLVRLVVGFPAGGPSDVLTRQFAPALEKELGQTVIVENIGGAGGTIAAARVLRAPADGYQVLVGSPMELIQAPISMLGANFKSDDFRLTGMVINTDMLLVGRKDLPYDSVDQLVAAAKSGNAAPISYGSVGHGSLFHLAGEYFAKQGGIELLHVPYRGAGPIIQDLMGGQIDIAFIPLAGPVLNLVETGALKPIALAGPQRHTLLPKIPTVNESAGFDDFAFDIWAALTVPKGTSENVMETLNDALARALTYPEVKQGLESTGSRVAQKMSIADQAQLYASEVDRYQKIAKLVGIEPQ